MDKRNVKLLLLAFMFVGLIFAGIGAGFGIYTSQLKKICTESTQAVVVENVRIAGSAKGAKSSRTATYAPVFEYTYNGETYKKQSSSASYPPAFQEGTELKIYVNPEKPEQFYVPDDNTIKFLCIVFFSLGLSFVLFSLLVLFTTSKRN